MKKKALILLTSLVFILSGCGNTNSSTTEVKSTEQILTPPELKTEIPLDQSDISRQQRADDVTSAATIKAAVDAALSDKEILESTKGLESRFFYIVEPLETNGESNNFAVEFVDKEMNEGLSKLTNEVAKNLGNKYPKIKYSDDNWHPTKWVVFIKTDDTVEVSLLDPTKEEADGLKTLAPTIDKDYQ